MRARCDVDDLGMLLKVKNMNISVGRMVRIP